MLDSLVRVSRRVERYRFTSIKRTMGDAIHRDKCKKQLVSQTIPHLILPDPDNKPGPPLTAGALVLMTSIPTNFREKTCKPPESKPPGSP